MRPHEDYGDKLDTAIDYLDDFEESDIEAILENIRVKLRKKVEQRHKWEKEKQIRDINNRNYKTAHEKWKKTADCKKAEKVKSEYYAMLAHENKHKYEWARRALKFRLADTVEELRRRYNSMVERGAERHGYRELKV